MISEERLKEEIEDFKHKVNYYKTRIEIYEDLLNITDDNQDLIEKKTPKQPTNDEKVKFIRAYVNTLSPDEILKLYNEKFNLNMENKKGGYFYKLIRQAKGIREYKNTEKRHNNLVENKEEKIKQMKILLSKGMKQIDVANQLGVTDMTIFNWKNGIGVNTKSKNINKMGIKLNSVRKPYQKSLVKFNSREEFLPVLKQYYFGSKEEKAKLYETFNLNYDAFGNRMRKLRNQFEIKPQEVGLTKFPINVGEFRNIHYFRIE